MNGRVRKRDKKTGLHDGMFLWKIKSQGHKEKVQGFYANGVLEFLFLR